MKPNVQRYSDPLHQRGGRVQPLTMAEWAARVRSTEASIAYAAQVARERERRRQYRKRVVREWLIALTIIAIVVLILMLANAIDPVVR